jgi:Tol biopolymer transport system component
VSRRSAQRWLWLLFAALFSGGADGQERIVDVRQGTDMAVAVSPDLQSIVVDLLGQLWELPVNGGGATPLTPPGERAKHPRFGPTGRYIAYQRYVDGQWDVWLLDLATGTREAMTDHAADDQEPDFLAASTIVFASDRTGNRCLWALDLDTRELTQLTSELGSAAFPTVASDGTIAYVRLEDGTWSLRVLGKEIGNLEVYRSHKRLSAPSWRPGGGVIVFHESDGTASSGLKMLLLSDERVLKTLTSNEDVFAVRAAWVSPAEYLYTADGQIWRRGVASQRRQPVHLFAGVAVAPALLQTSRHDFDAPGPQAARGLAGRSVAPGSDRAVFSALGDLWLEEDGHLRQLTNDGFVDADPVFTPDGEAVVFSSDRDDGSVRLWLLDIASRASRPLTSGERKAYRPAIAPSGDRIAYLETNGLGPWAPTNLRVLSLGREDTLLVENLVNPGYPRWQHNGSDADLELEISSTNAPGARVIEHRTQIPLRRTAATAVPREDRPNDALAPIWRYPVASEPYVVQVGRLFDGVGSTYRRHVDIHIDGHRISAIAARNTLPLPERVIDARDYTVLPGLIDVHTHQSNLAGERLGRLWLAHGVTTVREIAVDTLEAVARGEAWAAGRQPGPRLVISSALLARDPDAGLRLFESPGAMSLRGPGLLDAPVHASVDGAGIRVRPASAQSRWIAELAQPILELDLRTSPLLTQYQDVFGVIAAAGYVTNTAIASAFTLLDPPPEQAGWPRAVLAGESSARWNTASWLAAEQSSSAVRSRQHGITRLIRSGARVALGSDAPIVPYGLGVHLELALLAEAGIPNDQALRIATAEGALALGLDRDLGTVEPGKLADFIVIDGDPLERLSDAREIRAIVLNGAWIEHDELLEPP